LNAKKKQLLLDFPWDEHIPRLVAYTEWLIQGKHWNSHTLPKGQTAESIVRDVIEKTFSEKRNWDPDRGDLFTWLKWVIKSEVSHLAESAANRTEVHLDQAGENDSSADGPDVEQRQPSPRRQLIGSTEEMVMDAETEAEKTAEAQSKIDALLEACSGQPELEEIVYAIVDEQCDGKPRELAQFLGRPVEEIYQNLRSLRRRADKIRMETRNGQR
jgi:DNA-directed RNA polymerase specialized sigma24 family protein